MPAALGTRKFRLGILMDTSFAVGATLNGLCLWSVCMRLSIMPLWKPELNFVHGCPLQHSLVVVWLCYDGSGGNSAKKCLVLYRFQLRHGLLSGKRPTRLARAQCM